MSKNRTLIYIIDLLLTKQKKTINLIDIFISLPSKGKNVTSILHDDRNLAGGGQKTCPLFSTIALL